MLEEARPLVRTPLPGWRNWQTRQTQNLVLAREWEFDPPSGHQDGSGRGPAGRPATGGSGGRPGPPQDPWISLDIIGGVVYSPAYSRYDHVVLGSADRVSFSILYYPTYKEAAHA